MPTCCGSWSIPRIWAEREVEMIRRLCGSCKACVNWKSNPFSQGLCFSANLAQKHPDQHAG
eukprot:8786946-Karenia_brevis.AAC.1